METSSSRSTPYDYEITVDELPNFLGEAKSVLKTFLLKNDSELAALKKGSILKTGINRLFVYNKIRKVIHDNNLSKMKINLIKYLSLKMKRLENM